MTKAKMRDLLSERDSKWWGIQILDIEKLDMIGKGTEDVFLVDVYKHGLFSQVEVYKHGLFSQVEVYVSGALIVHAEVVA